MIVDQRYRLSTVKHVLEYYMENHGFQAESWQGLAYMTSLFIEVMGKKRVQDLRPEHFIAYSAGRKRGTFGKRRAKSSGTLLKELTHLQTAIRFCIKARVLDPGHAPFIPMPDKPPPRDRWLTKKEILALKAAAVPESRAEIFMHIALATAARRRAIETLEWSHINWQNNMIDFSKSKKRQTKKRRSIVPMQSDLRIYLEKIYKKSDGDYVLGNTGAITRALEAVARRAKVDGVTPHVFRHTWATHASMNKVPLGEIARVLGDSIATTERVYAKFQPDYLQTAIEQAAL